MRLDITFMRAAMKGADGKTKGVFAVLQKLATYDKMKGDLLKTLDDAKTVTNELLQHEWGPFDGIDRIESLEGTDELEGWAQAVEDMNKVEGIAWPKETIETLEDDLICQICIIFMMLDCFTKRVSGIISACMRVA